jgi:hypothetical protein
MRKIEELIYEDESAWPMIKEWISEAQNQVEFLTNNRVEGEKTILQLRVTNKSTMGAIALECGGILVDNGWLRILGSGNERISGNMLSWNNLDGTEIEFPLRGAMVIAYDIIGGFYAINAGGFSSNIKNVFYFAPDSLEWEDIEMGYTDFINWALNGDLNLYYKSFRWIEWESDIKKLSGDQGISIFPYLWTKEGKDIEMCSRRAVPMMELWGIQNQFANQVNK